jgi:hypothetical protein
MNDEHKDSTEHKKDEHHGDDKHHGHDDEKDMPKTDVSPSESESEQKT